MTLGRRSERWAVMFLLSAGSNGLIDSVCGDTQGTPSLALGSGQAYTHKPYTFNHTHFCRHNSRNTYVHQYQHKMNLCEDRSCQHKTYTNTHAFSNRVRHGIRDFRKDKFPRRTAMDYGWYSQCFEQWKYSLLMNVEHLCYK